MAVTRQRLEMFRLSVMQSAFCFPNITIVMIVILGKQNADCMTFSRKTGENLALRRTNWKLKTVSRTKC